MQVQRKTQDLRVLFFSRGRGRGHAIPDIEIVDALEARCDFLEVTFASYATGYQTFCESGWSVVDLNLPEKNDFLDTLISTSNLINKYKPQLILCHEEFAAVPAAQMFQLPVIFVTDWFTSPSSLTMNCLKYADLIVFIERPGLFPVPSYLRDRVHYVGPVIREMLIDPLGRQNGRSKFDLSQHSNVISVIPGSWASEERAPMAELIIDAFERLVGDRKNLIWLSERDYDALSNYCPKHPELRLLKDLWPTEPLMYASDIVITKANRGTTYEVACLGIPSVSLSFGLNPIDDIIAPHIPGNTFFDARGLSGQFLADQFHNILSYSSPKRVARQSLMGGADRAARVILQFIESHFHSAHSGV